MTKRQWIKAVLNGVKDLPIPQHWMSFFNDKTIRYLTPSDCHYENMWYFDVPSEYDYSGMSNNSLDALIKFNAHTGRCFACLGKGANTAFGHGGPGEFLARCIEDNCDYKVVEYETGTRAKIQYKPHYYHLYNHPVQSAKDVSKVKLPDPCNPARYKGLADNIGYLKSKGEFVSVSLNGFFSGVHYFFIEYQNALMSLVLDPAMIEVCLNTLGSWNLKAAEMVINSGADCISLCDDLGSKQNLLMSPEQYRNYIKPWHKKLCELAHASGVIVHLHSHGAISAILGDLSDCGFDIINPFDPEEGFNIENILQTYSSHFTICGGLPASFWELTKEDQTNIFEENGKLARKYGHFIFMDSGGISETVTKLDFDRILKLSRNARGVPNSNVFV